jgi:uncharacterized protein YdbL (DUF1318 family)
VGRVPADAVACSENLARPQPKANRKTLSVHDPEARRGKHGEFYEGYLTDILMDADSEIITQINVLEAG